ncbi:MAG: hypothetical protein ACYS8X_10260 [Planctomycetota bacterium]|jgi:hypothetical protein
MGTSNNDRKILRNFAKRLAEIAADPIQQAKLDAWKRHNSLQPGRPLIIQAPEGVWAEFVPASSLECADEFCRRIEHDIRYKLYHAEHFRDDAPITANFDCPLHIDESGWGIEGDVTIPEGGSHSEDGRPVGAMHFNTAIKDDADVETLIKDRTITVDWDRSHSDLARTADLVGDILNVRLCKRNGLALAPMDAFGGWRGYEQIMMDMIERPEWVHRALQRITDVIIDMAKQLEAADALSLNNGDNRVGSGGFGTTDELPAEDFDGEHVRLKDMWGFATTQIFSEVSPAMHDEFGTQYEGQFLELFGLNAYGCCEPLHKKIHLVRKLPRVRQVSMSPWIEPNEGAEQIGRDFIFSYRPNPSLLSSGTWDLEACRKEMITVFEAAKRNGCTLDMVLKDTHTCRGEPNRYDEWSDAAMQLAEQYA